MLDSQCHCLFCFGSVRVAFCSGLLGWGGGLLVVCWDVCSLLCLALAAFWVVSVLVIYGEFDPGSGRTLAACLTHASRAGLFGVQRRTGE